MLVKEAESVFWLVSFPEAMNQVKFPQNISPSLTDASEDDRKASLPKNQIVLLTPGLLLLVAYESWNRLSWHTQLLVYNSHLSSARSCS